MPFLLAHIRNMASTHLWSAILERSMTVPTVTVNCLLQLLHWTTPGRCALPCRRVTRSRSPQCGQTGPFGQCSVSRYARAASSSLNLGSSKAASMACPPTDIPREQPALCQPDNRPGTVRCDVRRLVIRSLLVMLNAWFAHFGSVAIHSTAFAR